MRKHIKEMIRFANSEDGTEVWYKKENSYKWEKTSCPYWDEDTIYIVDNEYAELRMESIDTGRPIQVYNRALSEWQTPTYEIEFRNEVKYYRLEPEEFEYPLYKKDKIDGYVVKFTDSTVGEVVSTNGSCFVTLGSTSNTWINHIDTDTWEDCDYKEPKYYYQWESLYDDDIITVSDWITDEYAENNNFEEDGWRKIESSKRTWDD